jgi:hypothetical protein
MEFIPRILEKIAPIGMMFYHAEKSAHLFRNFLKQIKKHLPK